MLRVIYRLVSKINSDKMTINQSQTDSEIKQVPDKVDSALAKEISEEKLQWLKEIGATEFEEPMKYSVKMHILYSEKYIRETPLEVLKERYGRIPT